MICKKCGSEVNAGAAFCPKCGTSLIENQAHVAEPVKKKSRTLSIVFLGLSILIGVFNLIFTLQHVSDGQFNDYALELGFQGILSVVYIVSILMYSKKMTMLGSIIGGIGYAVHVIILFILNLYRFPYAFGIISSVLWLVFFALFIVKILTNKINSFILIAVAFLGGVFHVLNFGSGVFPILLEIPFVGACAFLVLDSNKSENQTS